MASWKHITNFFASLYYKTDDMLRAFQQKLRSMFLDAAAISQSPSKSACGLGLAGRPAGDRRQPAVPGGGWAEDHGQRGRAHYYAAMCCRLVAGRPAGRRGRSSSWLTRTQRQHPIHPPVPRSFSPRPKSFRSSEFDRDGRRHIMRGSESSNS
jgi:hypothetical protein